MTRVQKGCCNVDGDERTESCCSVVFWLTVRKNQRALVQVPFCSKNPLRSPTVDWKENESYPHHEPIGGGGGILNLPLWASTGDVRTSTEQFIAYVNCQRLHCISIIRILP